MLRLAEQCLERAKSFIGKSTAPPDIHVSSSSSPGQSETHQSAVLPVITVPNTGEYSPSNHKHLFYKQALQWLLICSLLQRSQIKTSQCVAMWFLLCKPITTLCLSVSPPQSQSPHVTLLLKQHAKPPAQQRAATAGCCQTVEGSSHLFCLLKSSKNYKQLSHRTLAKGKGHFLSK